MSVACENLGRTVKELVQRLILPDFLADLSNRNNGGTIEVNLAEKNNSEKEFDS